MHNLLQMKGTSACSLHQCILARENRRMAIGRAKEEAHRADAAAGRHLPRFRRTPAAGNMADARRENPHDRESRVKQFGDLPLSGWKFTPSSISGSVEPPDFQIRTTSIGCTLAPRSATSLPQAKTKPNRES